MDFVELTGLHLNNIRFMWCTNLTFTSIINHLNVTFFLNGNILVTHGNDAKYFTESLWFITYITNKLRKMEGIDISLNIIWTLQILLSVIYNNTINN